MGVKVAKAGVLINTVAQRTPCVTTPMKAVYEEASVLESLRLSIETVCVQVACIVIHNHSWRLFEPCAEDLEGVSWRFATSQDIESVTDPMRAVDGEDFFNRTCI